MSPTPPPGRRARTTSWPPTRRDVLSASLLAGATVLAAGCAADRPGGAAEQRTLRLGYFANLTHAVPLVGVANGFLARALPGVTISESVFNAGPAGTEALLSGAIDATYIGPNPAINGYLRTKKQGIRVVAGGATGGAALVVRPGITRPEQLRGGTLATPQLGGTQDVALRAYLIDHGLRTATTGGQDVTVVAQQNAQTLELFRQQQIDGAWLPEPWVSRLVIEGGAAVLVDERTRWPGGVFPTTQLVVAQSFLQAAPDTVKGVLAGHVATVRWARANPGQAATVLNAQLKRLTGKALTPAVLARAYPRSAVGWDPVASAMPKLAMDAVKAGTAPANADLTGLFDLRPLNEVLATQGLPRVPGAGLELT